MSSIYIPSTTSSSTVNLSNYYTKGQTNILLNAYPEQDTNVSFGTGTFSDIVCHNSGSFGGLKVVNDLSLSGYLRNGTTCLSVGSESGTLATTENLPSTILNEKNGFANASHATFSVSTGTLQFTITPATGYTSFIVYCNGTKYTKTTQTVSYLDVEGLWYFYYNSTGTMVASQTVWSITTDAPIALFYWNAVDKAIVICGYEMHEAIMSWATHLYLHSSVGTRYASGLTLSGTSGGDGSSNTHANIDLTAGVIYDEDIKISITRPYSSSTKFSQNLATPAQCPVLYLSGAGLWRRKEANDYPLIENVGTMISYNSYSAPNWSLTPATSTNYVATWIVATNCVATPVFAMVGQRQDTSLTDAQNNNTITSLVLSNSPFPEWKIIYRLIFQTRSTYTNAVKARLVDITDLRTTSSLQGGTYVATSHSALSGLTNPNSHPASAISTTTFSNYLSSVSDVQGALTIVDGITINSMPTFNAGTGTFGQLITTTTGTFSRLVVSSSGTIGGVLNITNTLDSTATSDGSIVCAGGMGLAKKLYVGTFLDVASSGSFGGILCKGTTSVGSTKISSTGCYSSYLSSNNLISQNTGSASSLVSTWYTRAQHGLGNYCICWAPQLGLLIAPVYSTGKVYISPDGSNWSTTTITNYRWMGVVYGAELNIIVAVSLDGHCASSPDAYNWTLRSPASLNQWEAVCYSPQLKRFVAVADSGTGNRVITSDNGTSWTVRSSTEDNVWYDVCWSPKLSIFLAVASSGTNRVMTSSDGITWVTGSIASQAWNGICWSQELSIFCAMSSSSVSATSSDGSSWNTYSAPSNLRKIAWSPQHNLFVSVGFNKIAYSASGTSWTSFSSGNIMAICYAPQLGIFCAGTSDSAGPLYSNIPLPTITTSGLLSTTSMNDAYSNNLDNAGLVVYGGANIGRTLNVLGTGTSLYVASTGHIGGSLTVSQSGSFQGLYVSATGYIGGSLTVSQSGVFGGLRTSGDITNLGSVYLVSSGGTASALNHYEEYTFTTNLTGCWTSKSASYLVVRCGKNVTINLPYLSATTDATSGLASDSNLPTRFRSSSDRMVLFPSTYDGSGYDSVFYLFANGAIAYYKSSAFDTYTASKSLTFYGSCISYNVD